MRRRYYKTTPPVFEKRFCAYAASLRLRNSGAYTLVGAYVQSWPMKLLKNWPQVTQFNSFNPVLCQTALNCFNSVLCQTALAQRVQHPRGGAVLEGLQEGRVPG
jgi:hypothetical protein